ncbi:hypothetical protein WT02_04515 [Burkholderia stagnalis]|uniref:DUF2182 domain-containing protein n=1 Tax=Burkholderia stagnalis TaxID=1503054 RepID=UPI00075A2C81|nr:DUF2182 domain-containing protein [Burkholderia stagnalis]KVL84890.1 hypothetical protein WT02_04515 [Burkholderia stagnalis]
MWLSTVAGPACRRRTACFGVLAVLFAGVGVVTVAQCVSMAAMGGVPMPGGWTMSMAWARPCGLAWTRAAAAFLGMWGAMTAAMMLPALAPMLWRYRQAIAVVAGTARAAWLTALAGAGYFAVWALAGVAVFAAGTALAAAAIRLPAFAQAVPFAAGAAVLGAGAVQFTRWKARRLACCRGAPAHVRPASPDAWAAWAAWRHGLRLGLHCGGCCANLMAAAPAAGVMDPRVMAVATAAIAAERLAPDGARAARLVGGGALGAGAWLVARAAGLA